MKAQKKALIGAVSGRSLKVPLIVDSSIGSTVANAADMLMLCVQVKKSLSVAYGRFPGYTFDKLSTDKLRRKLAFCREVRDCTRRVFSFSFIT